MKSCRKCGHRLTTRSVTKGYKYYCPNCDEDMYGIEAVDVPVVTVRDYGDGWLGTRAQCYVARDRGRPGRHWAVFVRNYDLAQCRFSDFRWLELVSRTKREVMRSFRSTLGRKGWWNKWLMDRDFARRIAAVNGVKLRFVNYKEK